MKTAVEICEINQCSWPQNVWATCMEILRYPWEILHEYLHFITEELLYYHIVFLNYKKDQSESSLHEYPLFICLYCI